MTRLYFVVRGDLPEGRRASQLVHAGQRWTAMYGTDECIVRVHVVSTEDRLLYLLPPGGRTILWREPDLKNSATAFATDVGPPDAPLM